MHVLKGYLMQHEKYILFDHYLITAKMFSAFLSNHIQNLKTISREYLENVCL